jgi:hypothetical protein
MTRRFSSRRLPKCCAQFVRELAPRARFPRRDPLPAGEERAAGLEFYPSGGLICFGIGRQRRAEARSGRPWSVRIATTAHPAQPATAAEFGKPAPRTRAALAQADLIAASRRAGAAD